jgi:hypothetical protein
MNFLHFTLILSTIIFVILFMVYGGLFRVDGSFFLPLFGKIRLRHFYRGVGFGHIQFGGFIYITTGAKYLSNYLHTYLESSCVEE